MLPMNDIYVQSTQDLEEAMSDLAPPGAQPSPLWAAPGGGMEGLPPLLAAVVRGVEPPGLRQFMRNLFADVGRLLTLAECVRGAVERSGSLAGVPPVLDALRTSSRYLLTQIETAELRVEGLPVPLVEALERAGFALRHELRRVFETELASTGADGEPQPRAVLRACALLENCFQQLTICLARTFEAGLTGAVLFDGFRRRREQSLALLTELRALRDDVGEAERGGGVAANLALLGRVRRFRYERLHCLNYGDWEDFERFADALELSYGSEGEMPALLHRLSCYVGTLLSQVEMRAVLAEQPD